MRRLAARSAGPRLRPCMRGDAAQIASTLATPRAVSRIAWRRIGRLDPGLGLELGEQAVDVVDVLGALDLGDHDHVEPLADLGDRGGEVVERPRRVERVDPGPQLRVVVVPRLADLDQAGARRLLVARRDAVLEVGRAGRRRSGRSSEPWRPSSGSTAAGSGSSATAGTGSPAPAQERRRRAAGRSLWAVARRVSVGLRRKSRRSGP